MFRVRKFAYQLAAQYNWLTNTHTSLNFVILYFISCISLILLYFLTIVFLLIDLIVIILYHYKFFYFIIHNCFHTFICVDLVEV